MKQIANRYFYRIGHNHEPIAGTLAKYNKKPVNGKWKEITYGCCPCPAQGVTVDTVVPIETDLEIPSICTVFVALFIGDLQVGAIQTQTAGNMADFIATLNAYYGSLGTFSYDQPNNTINFNSSSCCVDLTIYINTACER